MQGERKTDLNRAQRLTPEAVEALDDQFDYKPWGPAQQRAGGRVREALKAAAAAIIECVPPGPDRAVALRKIREARMDANSAITHGGKY